MIVGHPEFRDARVDILLQVTLFGGFDARVSGGSSLTLPSRKSRALLAYLALHPSVPQSREKLASLLWGDRDDHLALNSLSQAVTALRKALGDAPSSPLLTDADSVTLNDADASVDVLEFVRLSGGQRIDDLEQAAALYRGELLAGIGVREAAFEEWLEGERRRLEALLVVTLSRLVAAREATASYATAEEAARRLLALDPFQEQAHRAVMRCLAATGQVGLALRQYDACADILQRELGVAPTPETTRLRDDILERRVTQSVMAEGVNHGIDDLDADDATMPPSHESPRDTNAGSSDPGDHLLATTSASPRWRTVAIGLLTVAVIATVVGVALVLPRWHTAVDGAPSASEDSAGQRASIVVLPFENLDRDPAEDYFVDGITEDLITDLAKIPALFVISRNSALRFRGQARTAMEIADELGVRYVLQGSVRRSGQQLRINVQLIEAAGGDHPRGDHLWTERFDGSLVDIFAFQDDITRRIVSALHVQLVPAEAERLRRRGTDSLAAYDAYLLGVAAYARRTPQDNAQAAIHFERAMRLDPDYARAYTALAKVYARAVVGEHAYAERLGIYWTEAYARARELTARSAAQPDADYHVLRSWLALRKHLHERAIAEAREALVLSPNDADALEALAEALIFGGHVEEGVAAADRALRQNPTLPAYPLYLHALGAFANGDVAAAVESVRRAIAVAPEREAEFSGLLAAALGELGALDQAQLAFERFGEGLQDRPTLAWSARSDPFANPRYHTWQRMDLAGSVFRFPFADAAVLARLASGFAAAGATRSVGGYLPLTRANRLDGDAIRALLFDHEIGGTDFWLSQSTWRQRRDADGHVVHEGYTLHAGLPDPVSGIGRIEDESVCDQWAARSGPVDICVAVFRVPPGYARVRWGDFILVTDTGPAPFSVLD